MLSLYDNKEGIYVTSNIGSRAKIRLQIWPAHRFSIGWVKNAGQNHLDKMYKNKISNMSLPYLVPVFKKV